MNRPATRVSQILLVAAIVGAACSGGASSADPEARTEAGTEIDLGTTLTTAPEVRSAPEVPFTLSGDRSETDQQPSVVLDGDYTVDYEAWSQLAVHGALEAEFFTDLRDIAKSATAVIVGTVIGEGPRRTIEGDAEGDSVTLPSLVVRVDELIAGELPDGAEVGGTVLVETTRTMSADLPRLPAIIFLRYKLDGPGEPAPGDEGKYRLISSQGLMIPGPDGRAVMPIFEAMYPVDDDYRPGPSTALLSEVRSLLMSEVVRVATGARSP